MDYLSIRGLPIPVSRIGFGGWGIGGDAYGLVDDRTSIRALETAFEMGVTLYDTANIYGNGRSEEIIGKFSRGRRDRIIISTKAGYIDYSTKKQDFSPISIRNSLENSMRRLGTDYLDIVFVHSPPTSQLLSDDIYDELTQMKSNGMIFKFGVSVRNSEDGVVLLNQIPVDSIQVKFNLIENSYLFSGLDDIAKKNNVLVIVKEPLSYGYLSGAYNALSSFGECDHRRKLSKSLKSEWADKVAAFTFLHKGKDRSLVQAAILFSFSAKANTVSIPGMKTPKQVVENINSLSKSSLSQSEFEQILKA